MTTTKKSGDEIRMMVSESYAEALRRSEEGGGGCCSGPAGVAAQAASYGEELKSHAEAGRSSFGCGNPLAFADVRSGQTVLDLGSGAGLDLLIAAEKVGPDGRVIGVDMTEEMIAAARENAARKGLDNVSVRKGVIEALPVADASVDWVISNCVVNLSPEKERVFAEIRRVLRPGGRFRIADIVAEDLPKEILELAEAYAACVAGAISEEDYLAGLRDAGLVDVQVTARQVYDAETVRGLIESDLSASPEGLEAACGCLAGAEGRVASVRIEGRRPA